MAAHRDTAFREQQMLEAAKKAILDSGDFLSLDQTAHRLGLPPENLDDWEAEGKIFSIQYGGCSLFPKYAFLADTGHGPVPGLKVILDVLRTKKGGWGIAMCFFTMQMKCCLRPKMRCQVSPTVSQEGFDTCVITDNAQTRLLQIARAMLNITSSRLYR